MNKILINKRMIIVIGTIICVLAIFVLLGILFFKRLPAHTQIITISDFKKLKLNENITLDINSRYLFIINQSKGKIDLKRILILTPSGMHENIYKYCPSISPEKFNASSYIEIYGINFEDTPPSSCCPNCNFADPKQTCCCCEEYFDPVERKQVKTCGNYLEPNCSGPTIEDCTCPGGGGCSNLRIRRVSH
ncbi:MAG: hypothetical protein JXB49_31705 [Bacteroidales bacterium]|nr:hypothetical protein [Bacteroidales bacterium]